MGYISKYITQLKLFFNIFNLKTVDFKSKCEILQG